jgi:hypothetical protein
MPIRELDIFGPDCGFLESNWCGVMSANQRQFSRCQLSEDNSSSKLVINGRSITCKLVEISIGGFGVITRKIVRVSDGDRVHLKTRGLDYIVSVSYQKLCDEGVFLGLKQVEEILPDNTLPPVSAPWLTTVAWAAALSTVAAAVYCLIGLHESLPK